MLLDTSGLFCCFDEGDSRHDDAVALFEKAPMRLTHSYVLAELVPLCHIRGLNRRRSLAFAADLAANPHVEVVWVDEALHQSALALLQRRLDKSYSLCDAVSFVLMRERGIADALTTDDHFEQEGFSRVLKPAV